MRILLDECMPRKIGLLLLGHEVTTASKAGLAGFKNGALLSAAAKSFDIFLTVDRNLSFQQNVSQLQIKVIVLHSPSNQLRDLRPLVPKLLKVLASDITDMITHVRG